MKGGSQGGLSPTARAIEVSVFSPQDVERFWAKVDKSGDCWLWTDHPNLKGYGDFAFRGKLWRAHRVSYALEHGYLPPHVLVCHRCDVRRCVRPSHIYAGSYRDNARDRDDHGHGLRRLPDALPRPCGVCGAEFTPRRKNPERLFCSLLCQRVHFRRQRHVLK